MNRSSSPGSGSGGEDTAIAHDTADNLLYADRTATHELLLSTDHARGFRANDFFTLYEIVQGATTGDPANPGYTVIHTVNTGAGRYLTVTTGNPLGDASSKASPDTIGLLAAGAELSGFASDVDETSDSVTLEPGIYIAHFHIGMYSAQSGDSRLSSNQRMNTYHDARMTIDGTATTISHLLSSTYIRPIGGTDGAYGAFTRSIIMRVPEAGAVSFRHAATGQQATGYLGCREIIIFKVGGSVDATADEPTGLEARLQSLEDKMADVTFDPETQQTWTPASNAIANGLYPLGRWRFIANGAAAGSYNGLDYSAAGWENDDGLTGAVDDAGIVWSLPNNINWSRTRLVITAADGTVKRTLTAQSLRNMPAARQNAIANFPASPPDHTARWLATSDTHPLSIGTLEATDRVALQVLADTHTPVWRGEIDNGFSQRVSRDTAGLKALTADLTAGRVATGFANVAADGSEGGLVMLDAFPSLADARGVAAGRYSVRVSGVANIVDEYVLVRVPAGTHPAQARVFVTQSHRLDDFGDTLNVMVHLGQTADSMWDLYADRRQWDAFTDTVTLQVTASAEHVGSTVFRGEISDRIRERVKAAEDALAEAQAMIGGHLLADFPAAGARNGLMARFQGEILHSRDFRQPDQTRGKRTMVVGNGPSGTDIAVAAGPEAAGGSVYLAIRTGVDLRPRYPYGVPRHAWMMLGETLPEPLCVWLQSHTGAIKYNLEDFGVWESPPNTGSAVGYRGPELLNALREGQVQPVRHPIRFDAKGAELADGRYLELDAVIMATGFFPVLHQYLDIEMQFSRETYYPETGCDWDIGPNGVRGWPLRDVSEHPNGRQIAGHPGLYLVGVFYKGRGAFYNMGAEAAIAAGQIKAQLSQRLYSAVAV